MSEGPLTGKGSFWGSIDPHIWEGTLALRPLHTHLRWCHPAQAAGERIAQKTLAELFEPLFIRVVMIPYHVTLRGAKSLLA